ncbi:MAG: DUF3098 domain-containing protein [Cryomorphaceae bacterium]|nr:MAG: DUF3098 domain-containing protein [Cryomorphaceae bacterium]|tara:strand:- start:1047 stop:1277 length:231 start_codon:yes stop_codon:yes gene_type:complete
MKKEKRKMVFGKKNYQLMLLGLAFITLGFFLMSGGGSEDPNIFNDEIYNFRRIRVAPILVVFGFIIEVYAIVKNPR